MNPIEELKSLEDKEQATHLMRFFKTGKGQYGEGDRFLGIRVPNVRLISKKYYKTLTTESLQAMLKNPYHEIRLCALLMMVLIYEKTDKKDEILNLYVKNTKYINNWDLVDLSAPKIIGADYIKSKDSSIIMKLANENYLWSQRIAVVSQWSVIREYNFDLIIELANKFLNHKHDLMHKAVGWMLREAGKKDINILLNFLDKNYKIMPRTMLRYSIEKLDSDKRKYYMS